MTSNGHCAARYNAWLLMKLTPKGAVFSFLLYSTLVYSTLLYSTLLFSSLLFSSLLLPQMHCSVLSCSPQMHCSVLSCSEGSACSINSVAACLAGLPLDCAQVPHVQEGHSRAALPPDGVSQGDRPQDRQGGARAARPLPAKGGGLCDLLCCTDAV